MNPHRIAHAVWLFAIVITMAAASATAAELAKQPLDPKRPPAIQTQQVPTVPPAVFSRLNQYASVRAAGFYGWAPNGRGMLIRTRFGDSAQMHRVVQPGARRAQLTFFPEPCRGNYIPQAKDGAMLLSMSQGGNENYQVYLFNPQKFETTLLTDGTSRNRMGPFHPSGKQVIISSNKRNGRDTDLYIANPRQPNSLKMLFQTDAEYWYAADWSRDGKTLLLVRYVSVTESYLATLDVASGKKTDVALPGGEKGAVGQAAFSADGKTILASTDTGSEFRQLAAYDLKSGTWKWLSRNVAWDVDELVVAPKSGQVAYAVNEDGASTLYLIDGDKTRRLKTPLGILSSLEFSPDESQLGFTLSRPDMVSDAYSLHLETEKLTRWTFSELGGLNPTRFVKPERIQFKSFDGRMIPAYYFRPKSAAADAKVPVIINIHGGPESQYRPYFSPSTQYYVSELGAAVIWPNVRGSRGYGKTYLKLDNAELRENSVRDIGALLDWIEKQEELDSSRVAVTGGSYGGYMVLASLVHYGDRLRAGIDRVGIANFITFLENTASYRRDLRRVEYGDERDPKIRKFFERINPTANANKIRSALLVAHGVNDPRVPFSEARQIADKVRAQGRPVWTVYAENEGHGFGKRANRDYLQGVESLFLSKHLGL